jgi:hypothetical protein
VTLAAIVASGGAWIGRYWMSAETAQQLLDAYARARP